MFVESAGDQPRDGVRPVLVTRIVILAFTIGLGIALGPPRSLDPPVGLLHAYWLGQGVQATAGVWFGGWGGIAGAFFPIVPNVVSGTSRLDVALAFLPANFVQSMAAGWAFRSFKANPSLRSVRDWLVWLSCGVIAANVVGGFWGASVLQAYGLTSRAAEP